MGDMLSQDEIEALLGSMLNDDANKEDENKYVASDADVSVIETKSDILSDEEKDVLGEMGNISMGTSATTLFALLNQRVLITTPRVMIVNWKELSKGYDRPCVGIRVNYTEGLEGSNVLILKERDVKIISSFMLGGDGDIPEGEPLNEIDLSAIAEAMNQMIGSASTSLSSLIKIRIDIDTPHAFVLDFNDDQFFDNISFTDDEVVCIAFRMEIGTLIDSEIMQIVPVDFAKEMVRIMKADLQATQEAPSPVIKEAPVVKAEPVVTPVSPPPVNQPINYSEAPPMQTTYAPQTQMYQEPQYKPQPVNVQPVQFQSFDMGAVMQQKENIDIIMDVPLEVTVELGRTSKKIKDILEFSPGTVIELDKLAGEPIDVLVNGKFVAKGEVVVIDESFGIRITDIINAEHRI